MGLRANPAGATLSPKCTTGFTEPVRATEWRIMEEMRRIAYETVLRACGFASLAIFCVMIGLSFLRVLPFRREVP